jgi:hypothetical protein
MTGEPGMYMAAFATCVFAGSDHILPGRPLQGREGQSEEPYSELPGGWLPEPRPQEA